MCTLYESIKSLCDAKGIKGGKMCVDLKISKSTMTDLKTGRRSGISLETAQKIADYFGVSVDRVLGTDTKKGPATKGEASPAKQTLLDMIDNMSDEECLRLTDLIAAAKKL